MVIKYLRKLIQPIISKVSDHVQNQDHTHKTSIVLLYDRSMYRIMGIIYQLKSD